MAGSPEQVLVDRVTQNAAAGKQAFQQARHDHTKLHSDTIQKFMQENRGDFKADDSTSNPNQDIWDWMLDKYIDFILFMVFSLVENNLQSEVMERFRSDMDPSADPQHQGPRPGG